ncbi:MAG: hypothetical protein AAF581_05495 [Planctomycetota bacterium]
MTFLRNWQRSAALAFLLVGCVQLASAQQSLTIQDTTVAGLAPGSTTVSMVATSPVQGFVLAVGYDTSKLTILSIDPTAAVLAAPAELVASTTIDAAGGATLGVVLDSASPFGGQTLPVGTMDIATINIMADIIVVVPEIVSLTFTDGTFGTPTLDNILVQGGLSIGAAGLTLNDGDVTIDTLPADQLTINDVTIGVDQIACAEITMDNSSGPVQGFVLAIEHDPNLILQSIELGAEAASAEFSATSVINIQNGGTIGVVMDAIPPFAGQAIAIGAGNHIASFCYSCVIHPVDDGDPLTDDFTTHPLTFVDGVLGTPPLDNVVVVSGLSLSAVLNNGSAKCEAAPLENTLFACGAIDSEANLINECLQGGPGDEVEVCFFWQDPDDAIKAFQIGACWDNPTSFTICPGSCFDITDTILEAVGAEFVTCDVDNVNGDFIVGILLDFIPPFEAQTVPPTADWLKIGSVDFCIDPAAPCGDTTNITFCDADGNGTVVIDSLVTAVREVPPGSGNYVPSDIRFFPTVGCCIDVKAEREFVRGNCNNDPQDKVTISDAAMILAFQFQGAPVGCLDACDVNDDGKINLADTVYLLNYLFKSGPPHNNPQPPEPFDPDNNGVVDQGVDTTVDQPSGFWPELDCADGRDPCAP